MHVHASRFSIIKTFYFFDPERGKGVAPPFLRPSCTSGMQFMLNDNAANNNGVAIQHELGDHVACFAMQFSLYYNAKQAELPPNSACFARPFSRLLQRFDYQRLTNPLKFRFFRPRRDVVRNFKNTAIFGRINIHSHMNIIPILRSEWRLGRATFTPEP